MRQTLTERATTWLLRLIGGTICLAFVPVFFPLSWMQAVHVWLGLGDMPQSTIVEYLARSLSAMYFAHGVVVLAISTDVRRYCPLVSMLGYLNMVLGAIFLGVDLVAQMPWFWTISEGPPIALMGLVLLLISRAIASSDQSMRKASN